MNLEYELHLYFEAQKTLFNVSISRCSVIAVIFPEDPKIVFGFFTVLSFSFSFENFTNLRLKPLRKPKEPTYFLREQATRNWRENFFSTRAYIRDIWYITSYLSLKLKAKSFTIQVAHGAGAYFRFL